jgi:hypothetical protein
MTKHVALHDESFEDGLIRIAKREAIREFEEHLQASKEDPECDNPYNAEGVFDRWARKSALSDKLAELVHDDFVEAYEWAAS